MQNQLKDAVKKINNQDGLALVSALMLGAIGMLLVASLMLMTDSGTWLSGAKKRYQIALDSAYGGMEFFTKEIIQRGISGTNLGAMGNYGGVDFNFVPSIADLDFTNKLNTTGDITDGAYPNDAIDTTLTLTYPNAPNIIVNSTIIRTSRGNSGTSANNLQTGGVVNNTSGAITPQHIPYLYQTQNVGQAANNPREAARLSSIYAY